MSTFDQHFFLQSINEQYSVVFGIVYAIVFFMIGGWFPTLLSIVGGLVLTLLLNRLVINPRQPVPKGGVVVISGCSSGIGKAAAIQLAIEGFTVFATLRKESDARVLLARMPEVARPGQIIPLICDVTKQDQIDKSVATVKKFLQENPNLGMVGVINNAGYSHSVFLELATQEQITAQYETNVFGVRNFTNGFLPLLRQHPITKTHTKLNPKVIVVSSALTKMTVPGYGLYASTKIAVERLVDAYRQELRLLGIDVVSVVPGSITTQFGTNTKRKVIEPHTTEPTGDDYLAKMQYYADAQEFLLMQEKQSQDYASDPQVVVDVFMEALLSPRPLARYMAGRDCHGMSLIAKLPPGVIKYFPIFKNYFKTYFKAPEGGVFPKPKAVQVVVEKKKEEVVGVGVEKKKEEVVSVQPSQSAPVVVQDPSPAAPAQIEENTTEPVVEQKHESLEKEQEQEQQEHEQSTQQQEDQSSETTPQGQELGEELLRQ